MPQRVLVVDDHPPTVRLIQNALEQEGFSVITAANGAECLMAVHQDSPDVVILDVIMPVMDGLQTLRVIRENEATKTLPVIVLSVRDSDQDVLDGWRIGADLYLTKPFKLDDLLAAVKRIIQVADGR
jgi:DNA-binding response OmpR family regulator